MDDLFVCQPSRIVPGFRKSAYLELPEVSRNLFVEELCSVDVLQVDVSVPTLTVVDLDECLI